MANVLGGGISGLSAAYYLSRTVKSPTALFESSDRIGGWIKSTQQPGYIFESGPRTIRPAGIKGKNTLQLIENVGLSDQVRPICASHPAAKNRMIYANGKLNLLPSAVGDIFKTLPPFSKPLISAVIHDLVTQRNATNLDDESIYSFTERRFGREIAEYAISPMICGICAGDAKRISVKFLMEDIFRNEQKYGGVIRGAIMNSIFGKKQKDESVDSQLISRSVQEKWRIYSLAGGLQSLPNTLCSHVQQQTQTKVHFNAQCTQIKFSPNEVISTVNNEEFPSNAIISSIPSYKLAGLVRDQHPKLSQLLDEIIYVDVATVNIQFDKPNLLESPGFGFLVPPSVNRPILGVIFDSDCFDITDHTLLTVMMGGHWFHEKFGANPSEQHLLDVALDEIKSILKIDEVPNQTKVNILRKCIPQYVVGHRKLVNDIRTYIKDHKLPLFLCGAAYDGVGVNDVIYSSKMAVNDFLNK
ncbi:protoporphyrinogen oxidase [Bradysia coprophila]|uniref:protoporphyrinogen oxidase n=1 Tax=Bradysia coprophila TaxID=38358 RepID=UPI00187DD172|nr:protoporphyrinogen oxidase [Bradysia coprophila]XP_037030618.1 protoporphyrinogen oxidase [Bradysia coprophila]